MKKAEYFFEVALGSANPLVPKVLEYNSRNVCFASDTFCEIGLACAYWSKVDILWALLEDGFYAIV